MQAFEQNMGKRSSGDSKWLQQVRRSGTTSDKVAAMSVLVQDGAVANLHSLDGLLAMCSKKGGECIPPPRRCIKHGSECSQQARWTRQFAGGCLLPACLSRAWPGGCLPACLLRLLLTPPSPPPLPCAPLLCVQERVPWWEAPWTP